MGIGSSYMVSEAEADLEQSRANDKAIEAAKRVVNGEPRNTAIQNANNLFERQQEALSSGDYVENNHHQIEFLDTSLNDTPMPPGKEHQVHAIARELSESLQ